MALKRYKYPTKKKNNKIKIKKILANHFVIELISLDISFPYQAVKTNINKSVVKYIFKSFKRVNLKIYISEHLNNKSSNFIFYIPILVQRSPKRVPSY